MLSRAMEESVGGTAPMPRTGTTTLPPGSSPFFVFFLASGPGEIKLANAQTKGGLLALHVPTLGVLGKVRGWALEPLFTQVQAPESADWRPQASGNTGRVCACVQVWVYVCAYFAHLSRELRVGLEEVGNRRMSSSISSSAEGIRRRGL